MSDDKSGKKEPSFLEKARKAILGEDKPRKVYQSGKKVKTRAEKMCDAGDENACDAVSRGVDEASE